MNISEEARNKVNTGKNNPKLKEKVAFQALLTVATGRDASIVSHITEATISGQSVFQLKYFNSLLDSPLVRLYNYGFILSMSNATKKGRTVMILPPGIKIQLTI